MRVLIFYNDPIYNIDEQVPNYREALLTLAFYTLDNPLSGEIRDIHISENL